VSENVELPPMQQTPVNARVSSGKLAEYVWNEEFGSEPVKDLEQYPYDGVLESDRIKGKLHVYSARCVIPAWTVNLKVALLNTKRESQMIPRGTELGEVHDVEEVRELDRVEDGPVSDLKPPETEALKKIMKRLSPDLTKDQRQKTWSLLVKYRGIISTGDHDIGRTDLVEYHIDTGNNRPIRQPFRRHPFQHLEWIDKEVEEMRKHGIIEPAASPWASNVVLVKKKYGTLRFCIDYRRLNSVTRQDSYPLPLIDNCLNALSGYSWYSTLDLRSGYYNIPIAEEDRDKSAFVTRSGCYRFTVMPFGLTCAPSVFQRLMDCVLCGLSYLTCLVYLDDVIVFGRSFEEQLYRLDEVFARLRSAKLKLKPSKCSFFQRSVEFLGHVVSENGIAMQDEKISAIRDWPPCRNVTEVRSFMGLTGYYRRFVKDFSIIAARPHEERSHWTDSVFTRKRRDLHPGYRRLRYQTGCRPVPNPVRRREGYRLCFSNDVSRREKV